MATDLMPAASTGTDDARLVAFVTDLIAQMRRDFSGAHQLYGYTDDVIYGRIRTNIPKGYRKIGKARRNPLANYFVSTITAALTADPPRVQFPQTGIGDSAATNATRRETFFDAAWERQQREAGVNIFRRWVRPIVSKGTGVIKTLPRSLVWMPYSDYTKKLTERLDSGDLSKLDSDAKDRLFHAKTEEYKRDQLPYPIRSTDVPPDQFMWRRNEDGFTVFAEHKAVPYLETLEKYGYALDGQSRVVQQGVAEALPIEEWGRAMQGGTALTMSEVWLWDRCIILLSGPGQGLSDDPASRGTLVKERKHRFGNPYTKTLRGPYFVAHGVTTESRLPEYAGLGMLYGYLDLFVMLDELLTIQQINAVMTGLASYKRNQPPPGGAIPDVGIGEDGRPLPRRTETLEPGTVFPYDIGPVEQPRAGAALGETISQTREFLEQILPRVLQGVVDTTDSGYQLAQAVRLGKVAFQPLLDNMRVALAQRVGFESRLIEEHIGETVYAWGEPPKRPGRRGGASATLLSIGPDDLAGVHDNYRVLLSADATNEQLIDVRKHREMVDGGLEDISDAREALGLNAEEVDRKIRFTKLKEDPDIQALLKQRIMRKIAAADQRALSAATAALGAADQAAAPPGAALQGVGQVYEPGQNGMQVEPTVPGQQIGIPATPAGAPGGTPPVGQQPPPIGMGV